MRQANALQAAAAKSSDAFRTQDLVNPGRDG
jgi:hypothetical protein